MLILEQFLRLELVVELASTERDGAIRELAEAMATVIPGLDTTDFVARVMEREHHSPTAIGMGIAMPHAKYPGVDQPFLVVGFSRQGVDFNSSTGEPVRLLFMTAVGSDNAAYMKLVARLAWLVRNQEIRQELFQAESASDLYELLIAY